MPWCSMPENKRSRKEWQYHTDFSSLREEFPKLVDDTGYGWLCRYVVALGKRDLLWDLLLDVLEPNVLEVRHAE